MGRRSLPDSRNLKLFSKAGMKARASFSVKRWDKRNAQSVARGLGLLKRLTSITMFTLTQENFCAATKITADRESVHTQERLWQCQPRSQSSTAISDVTSPRIARTGLGTRLWQCDFWRGELSCAALISKVERHISERFCAIIGAVWIPLYILSVVGRK